SVRLRGWLGCALARHLECGTMRTEVGEMKRVELVQGDITKLEVDAIVTAANESLLGGGGVDGAVHRAAGPEVLQECMTIGICPEGEARITKGYFLPAKHVIHAVGPVYETGEDGGEEV